MGHFDGDGFFILGVDFIVHNLLIIGKQLPLSSLPLALLLAAVPLLFHRYFPSNGGLFRRSSKGEKVRRLLGLRLPGLVFQGVELYFDLIGCAVQVRNLEIDECNELREQIGQFLSLHFDFPSLFVAEVKDVIGFIFKPMVTALPITLVILILHIIIILLVLRQAGLTELRLIVFAVVLHAFVLTLLLYILNALWRDNPYFIIISSSLLYFIPFLFAYYHQKTKRKRIWGWEIFNMSSFQLASIVKQQLYLAYNYKSMWKNLILILAMVAILDISNAIFIPLTGRVPRCTIVYSVGQSQTVKLDINFPPLPQMQEHQFFVISWKNTENDALVQETTKGGRYKRELALTQNVIYDLCIRVDTIRDYGIIHVEYSAHNLFAVNQAEVKVPANLLKSSDVTNSYLNAESIQKNLDAFIKIQDGKASTHAELFRKTNKISERLVQISIAELVIIIVAGIYQFWALWRYLKNKNYL